MVRAVVSTSAYALVVVMGTCALVTSGCGGDLGFALAITADIDPSVTLSNITQLGLTTTGTQSIAMETKPITSAKRTERIEVKLTGTAPVVENTITVSALAGDTIVAQGSTTQSVTVNVGDTKSITIKLLPLSSSIDLGSDMNNDMSVRDEGMPCDGPCDAGIVEDAAPSAPAAAQAVGYTNITFNSTTIGSTKGQLLPFNFFTGDPPTGSYVQNSDGSFTLPAIAGTTGGILSTATEDDSITPSKMRGIAFGGGGYFEATMSISGAPDMGTGAQFWASDVEHATGTLSEPEFGGKLSWVDVYALVQNKPVETSWVIQMHNWYNTADGGTTSASPTGLNTSAVSIPNDGKFTDLHTYAFLWVPATSTANGTITFYCDGMVINSAHWDEFETTEPYPPMGLDVQNVMDELHMMLIFGTRPGIPITVTQVRVWQASAAHNIEN